MKRSLRTQMLVQYVVIVIICMLVIPTGISKLLDRQFRLFAGGSPGFRGDIQQLRRQLEQRDADGVQRGYPQVAYGQCCTL